MMDELMDLKRINKLLEKNRYNDALDVCNEMLSENPAEKINALRMRAYVYSHMGDYRNALKDRREVFELGGRELKDYYLAADNAMELRDFEQASYLLEKVIKVGEEQGINWFQSASYFNLAYAQMKLGHYKRSLAYLEDAVKLESDCSMPLPGLGIWNHKQLREEIIRRMLDERGKSMEGSK